MTVATRFVRAVEVAMEPLRRFPRAGATREQFAPDLRVTFHGSYAIYYRALTDAVVVVRILHAARDAAALAEGGGFAESAPD